MRETETIEHVYCDICCKEMGEDEPKDIIHGEHVMRLCYYDKEEYAEDAYSNMDLCQACIVAIERLLHDLMIRSEKA